MVALALMAADMLNEMVERDDAALVKRKRSTSSCCMATRA